MQCWHHLRFVRQTLNVELTHSQDTHIHEYIHKSNITISFAIFIALIRLFLLYSFNFQLSKIVNAARK